jgi:hypothetical protein
MWVIDMGRKRRNLEVENSLELRYRMLVRRYRGEGVSAPDAFKLLCEQGVTFDLAFEYIRDEYGVTLVDLINWAEEEGWFREGGWLRQIEEGMGVIISGRLMRRALEGSLAAMKAYLVKWRPDEWSERLKVEQVGETRPMNVVVVLGYEPSDLKGRQLKGVEVVDITKQLPEGGDEVEFADRSEEGEGASSDKV